MEAVGSLQCSQGCATGPYPKPHASSQKFPPTFP